MASLIKYAEDGRGLATITFDRDDKRNAVNEEMAGQILQGLQQAEDNKARLVVLRANRNASVWCAGHDLTELDPQALLTGNPTLDIVAKIQSSPLPVVAMVEGSVYAGGLLIVVSADIVIAARNARAAITSNRLGIPLEPELYAHWLRVMGLHKVKELLFTAATISAEDAYHAGLYNHVVDHNQLEQVTQAVAENILQCVPEGVANAKYLLNLIARQSSLSDPDRSDVQRRNADILNGPQTSARIEAHLASLRNPS